MNFKAFFNNEDKIKKSIQENGFSILDMPDDSTSTLESVTDSFGNIQFNNNTNENGISEVIGIDSPLNNIASVVSNLQFNPHTDGAYLHGIAKNDNGFYYKVSPPKLVLLQCVKPADVGGDSYLIDGQFILQSLLYENPLLAKNLLTSATMCISHRDHLVMDVPIFNRVNYNSMTIRYSYDKSLFYPEYAKTAHEELNSRYLNNEKFIQKFKLKSKQILVIDNRRMLHGRFAFEGSRHLRRTWVQDETLSTHLINAPVKQEENYFSKKPFTLSFDRYKKYQAKSKNSSINDFCNLNLGISLSKGMLKVLNKFK